jgi:hypothetical protein
VVKHLGDNKGLVLLPRRWVVECSFVWASRFRRLAKDYERLPETVLDRYVVKPMHGWEGAGVRIVADGVEVAARPERHAAGQECVYQQFVDLPSFEGNHPVLGTWIVGGHAAGLGIRESDRLVTDTNARFVPHFLNAPRSTREQVAAWLAEPSRDQPMNGGTSRDC